MTFPPKLKNACFVVSLMSIGLLQIATNTNQMQSLIGYALTPPIVLLVGIVLLKKLDVVRRACAIVSENKRIGHVSFLWAVMTAVAFIGNFWLFLSVKVYPSLSALLRCGGTVAVILVGVASVYALYVIYVFLMKFVFDRLPAFLRGICVCEAAAGVFAWVVLFAAAAYYLFAYNVQANLFFYDTDTLWQLRNWYSDSFNSISNAYTYICHQANLLKESTFGIFSMPIMVPFALLAFAVEAVSCKDIFPLLACFANIGLIVFSALNFSRAFGLGRVSSTCFILLYCFSFSAIMNAIFPEQYVMSIFFVSLTVLAIVRKDPARTPLYMASTTMLLSSGILIFFAGAGNTFKKWIGSLLKWGLIFVALILIFGQLHTVVKFLAADALVGRFASRDSNNVVQFSDSLSGIFVQPNTLYSLDSPTLSDSGNYAAYIRIALNIILSFWAGLFFCSPC